MDVLPAEIFCAIIDYLDARALASFVCASKDICARTRESVRTLTCPEHLLDPARADAILALPNLRAISGITFHISGYKDVIALRRIPPRLHRMIFALPAGKGHLALPLIQRLIDLAGPARFAQIHWIFFLQGTSAGSEECVRYIVVRDARVAYVHEEGGSVLDTAAEYLREVLEFPARMGGSLATASLLFRTIYEEGELGHVDPLDPTSPLLRDVITLPRDGVTHDWHAVLAVIALYFEWILHGLSRLCRWSALQSREYFEPEIEDQIALGPRYPRHLLPEIETPQQTTPAMEAQVQKETSILEQVRKTYINNDLPVWIGGRTYEIYRSLQEIHDAFTSAGFSHATTNDIADIFARRPFHPAIDLALPVDWDSLE